MSNQGTIRLKVTNGAPAIEKLWNGRFKLEFFCDNNSPKEDWYYENVSALLPEYGILQTTNFGSGVSEDWEAIPDSVYPDMRLVLSEYPYNARSGKHYVKLTYETLTASWVEEKDEDTDYELNGLKKVSRTFVALPGTTYDKVVGTSAIDSNGTTLYLGSFKIEKTDAKWSLTEVWLEAGTLSETLDNVGSQKARVIETIGADPFTPSGYSLASKQESDFEGFQTNRFTFLKNNVILSESEDKVGSQLAIVQEVFNGTPVAPIGYLLANTQESDVGGIPTRRYTFLKPSVLSRNISTKNQGALKIEVVNAFNETPTTTISGTLITTAISDFEGIPTKSYTFAAGSGVVSTTIDTKNQGALIVTTTTALGSASGSSNVSATTREEDGYTIYTNVGATGSGVVSTTTEERNQGALIITTTVALGSAFGDSNISSSSRAQDGYTIFTNVGATGSGLIETSSRMGPAALGVSYITNVSIGSAQPPGGILVAESMVKRGGHTVYSSTAMAGNPTGIKATYADVATVEVPGTVNCTTANVTEGGVSGTIAITNSVPRRQKQVETTVTIEITTLPPTSAARAYDLGEISCSVTSVQTKLQSGDGSVATAVDGSTTLSQVGYQKSFASSASIQHYVGSYLESPSSTGSVSYQSSSQPYLSAPNAISTQDAFSSASSSCTGSGATTAAGFFTAGVISRSVRPIVTDLDGIIYYEVTTEETT